MWHKTPGVPLLCEIPESVPESVKYVVYQCHHDHLPSHSHAEWTYLEKPDWQKRAVSNCCLHVMNTSKTLAYHHHVFRQRLSSLDGHINSCYSFSSWQLVLLPLCQSQWRQFCRQIHKQASRWLGSRAPAVKLYSAIHRCSGLIHSVTVGQPIFICIRHVAPP